MEKIQCLYLENIICDYTPFLSFSCCSLQFSILQIKEKMKNTTQLLDYKMHYLVGALY